VLKSRDVLGGTEAPESRLHGWCGIVGGNNQPAVMAASNIISYSKCHKGIGYSVRSSGSSADNSCRRATSN